MNNRTIAPPSTMNTTISDSTIGGDNTIAQNVLNVNASFSTSDPKTIKNPNLLRLDWIRQNVFYHDFMGRVCEHSVEGAAHCGEDGSVVGR